MSRPRAVRLDRRDAQAREAPRPARPSRLSAGHDTEARGQARRERVAPGLGLEPRGPAGPRVPQGLIRRRTRGSATPVIEARELSLDHGSDWVMDYRQLGSSGLRVSALTLGTMTFGGRGNFAAVGSTDVAGATRQVDLCLDRGINFIDTANVYSGGLSEEIVGEAVKGRRDRVLLATKARMPMGDGPNDAGLSRHHLIAECEASLRRLQGRPHRPLPGARVGRPDAARGDDRGARLARALGQGPLRRRLELLGLAAHEGARRRRPPRLPALRHPADLLLAAGARRRVRAPAAGRRPGRRHPRLEPAGRRPAVGQVPARLRRPGGRAPPHRLGRAAGAQRRPGLRRRRRAGRDRRGPRRLGRPGRDRLAAPAARDRLGDRRRAHRRAARRQPRRRRPAALRRRARPARGGQPAAADLPALAPGQDRERPPVGGRPRAAGTARRRVVLAPVRRCERRAHGAPARVDAAGHAPGARRPRRPDGRVAAAAHRRARRELLDRRGHRGRHRVPSAARDPGDARAGRLAAALLPAAARVDERPRDRRGGDPHAVAAVRAAAACRPRSGPAARCSTYGPPSRPRRWRRAARS